ncbi:DUF3859 domain-containing protein [uncultured Litoreibacter sp.]|uniref:DUF3859 domain-containing protein n=2 Tax=uncultured Litoreibacter sp. TaxID=1392394 RepID=UPI00262935E7|nr:DUF3859 domain-containing protein [uncultured Litoreibacter sp.]
MANKLLISMIFVPLPVMAAGVSFDQTRVQDLKFGLVCGSDTDETIAAPDTATGTVQVRQDWQKIVAETQTIPLVKGLALGVDMRPVAPRVLNNVRITVTHPPFIGSELTQDSWTANMTPKGSNLNFFEFEHPYEFVEGTWTFEARKGFRTLYSVTFQVVDPALLPQLAGVCDGVSLTS